LKKLATSQTVPRWGKSARLITKPTIENTIDSAQAVEHKQVALKKDF
jgi:hypothetical protein